MTGVQTCALPISHGIVGTVYIPAGVGATLAILPLLGYGRMRKFGHVIGVLVITGLLVGVLALTVLGLGQDRLDPGPLYTGARAEIGRASCRDRV